MKGNLKSLITAALTATMTVGFLPQVAIKAEEKKSQILFQDFESDEILITNTSGSTGKITTEDKNSGEKALKFHMNGAGGDPKTDSGSIKFSSKNGAIDVTNSLKLNFKTKDTQGNNGYKISLVDINGNETNFAWADGPNGNKDNWTDGYISLDKFYEESPSVDFTQIVEVRFGQWNNGIYYLDDFYFDNALAEAENKKENFQSFENGGDTFTTTNSVNGYIVSDEKFSGNSALKYEKLTSGNTDKTDGAILIKSEEEYINASEYKYLVMRFKDTQGSNTMLVGIEDKFGNVSNFDWYDTVKTVQNEWIEYYIPMSFFSGVNKEFVNGVRLCQWNSGVYYIDDVYFTNKLDSEIGVPDAPTYTDEIVITEDTNIKAVGYNPLSKEYSDITEFSYTITNSGKVQAPTMLPIGGTYRKEVSVKLTSKTEGETIYYTIDGTEPTTKSNVYDRPIKVSKDMTIKAIAVMNGKTTEVVVNEYNIEKEESAFLKADGKNLRNNYGSGNIVALRGTNVGGWLVTEEWQSPTNGPDQLTTIKVFTERFGEEKAWELINTFQDNWWTEEDFDIVKAEGMNTLRLPITYFEMMNNDGSLKETAFDRLDWFLEEAAKRELYVIVDMHGAVGSQNGKDHSGDISNPDVGNFFGNEENLQKTIYLWEEIAKKYVDNQWIAGYDLLNEPGGALGTEQFEAYDRIYDAIRAIDKNHVLFIQAIWEPYHLPNPELYRWENVAYEYHFYGWDDLNNAEYQKAFIDSKVEMVNEMTNYDVPLLVGEYTFFENVDSWDYGLSTFVEQGWSFTSWTYKVHGAGSSWGMYTGETEKVDIYTDSFEEIIRKWSTVRTTESYTRNDKISDVQKKYFAAEVAESAEIIANDVVIEINSKFNPLDGVTAVDRDGSDITEKVQVVSNDVNVNKVGTYTVIYSVVDNINRTETKEITVTVEGKETSDTDKDDIIIEDSKDEVEADKGNSEDTNLPQTGIGYNKNITLILGMAVVLAGAYCAFGKKKLLTK